MKKQLVAAAVAGALAAPLTAHAGAKVEFDNGASVDLGFRVQSLYINSSSDAVADSSDFKIRRGRLRLGATVTPEVSMFLQTDVTESGGPGQNVGMIDAFIKLKPDDMFQLIAGQNMAPVLRQNLTSSGGLMPMDRTSLVYKNLSWGTRAVGTFANNVLETTDAGLRSDVGVRDMGLTAFGSTSLSEGLHFKYYAGTYDGANTADDTNRFSGRVQFNLGDAEPGYYNLSTYHGGKDTLGIGVAYDMQADVGMDENGDWHDYSQSTVDVFGEKTLGGGALSFEAGYMTLDLGDGDVGFVDDANNVLGATINQAQGSGYYAQAGYTTGNWQPWVEYEAWASDDDNDVGSFNASRVGVTYLLKGHNANIKAGYETLKADESLAAADPNGEDTINAFVVGVYVTY